MYFDEDEYVISSSSPKESTPDQYKILTSLISSLLWIPYIFIQNLKCNINAEEHKWMF